MPNKQKFTKNDPAVLLRRIKAHFPDLKWKSYENNTEGWDHEVLILDNRFVFRFPNEDDYLKYLKAEAAVLKRLKPLVSVLIPEYSYVPSDFSFVGYNIIPGLPLSVEIFSTLNQDAQDSIAKQLADFLSVIHTLTKNSAEYRSAIHSDIRDYQKAMKEQVKEYLSPILSETDYLVVEDILSEVDDLLAQNLPKALIHGDIYHDHLLWDSKRNQLGIIDFSDMNIGDPAFDFAELFEYGENYVRKIYEYYTGAKDETFLVRARKYQKWVGVYMMVDHFIYRKTSFKKARQTFDQVKSQI